MNDSRHAMVRAVRDRSASPSYATKQEPSCSTSGDGQPHSLARRHPGQPGQVEYAGRTPDGTAHCSSGYDRTTTPEALLGDACVMPETYICDKQRLVPGVRSWPHELLIEQADYPTVGPIGQTRAVLERMFSGAAIDPTIYPLVSAGAGTGIFDATGFATGNFVAGFVLAWGVQLLNFVPFSLHVVTRNWKNEAGISVDRDFILQVDGRVNGNSVFVPFALRVNRAMGTAQAQLAKILGTEGALETISVVQLPGNVEAAFSATAKLLSAFHPMTSAYAGLLGVYDAEITGG